MKLVTALVAAGVAAFPFSAMAAPDVLAPAGKWEMNHAENSCSLSRSFGTGDNAVLANFIRFQPSDAFRLTLTGKPLRHLDENRPVTIDFNGDGTSRDYRFIKGTVNGTPAITISAAIMAEPAAGTASTPQPSPPFSLTADQERALTSMQIDGGRINPVVLQLGPMDGPMQAMRACTDSLLAFWGFDPAVQSNLSRKATPTAAPSSWLTASDYPAGALNSGTQGIVVFLLTVEPDGSASGCRVLAEGNPGVFNTAVCSALQRRAHFEPAQDASGAAVKSYFVNSVYFRIP